MHLQKAPSVNTGAGILQSVQLLGYGLDNEGIMIRFPARPRGCPFIQSPEQFWRKPNFLCHGYWEAPAPRGKEAVA